MMSAPPPGTTMIMLCCIVWWRHFERDIFIAEKYKPKRDWYDSTKTHMIISLQKVRKLRGTIVNIVLPPRVLFHCREIYFTAATFILLPRVLFYCREFYFSTASFILLPRVLLYHREFYFAAASFIFTTASFILLQVVKIKLAAAKWISRRYNKTRGSNTKLAVLK